ncbi:hypothetical protein DMUE_0968 [Dictyocoela muelleri]|nr:hypothetical protein DMUE_0968 [Dictyocoela muelleri]
MIKENKDTTKVTAKLKALRWNSGMHNNISNNKKLYLDFSLFKDSPPRRHVRYNSTDTASSVIPERLIIELLTNRTIKKFEKSVTIEYHIENTDIKMKRELNILDNYEQYIF